MTTEPDLIKKERARLKRLGDDKTMIDSPKLWPHAFGLPLKRRGAKFSDDRLSGSWGFITSSWPNVVICDLMPFYNLVKVALFQDQNGGGLFDGCEAKIIKYPNTDALVADGWIVD